MSDRQQDVRWLQVRALHDRSYIAGILLPAHGLTVKLSPCPCSHSSPPGRIAACLCGHPKCILLLAQARPRMIQHLSSLYYAGPLSCILGCNKRCMQFEFKVQSSKSMGLVLCSTCDWEILGSEVVQVYGLCIHTFYISIMII